MTIQYDPGPGTLLGINTFGMRLRHGVLESWLLGKKTIEHALEHLADANFDPEFFRTYEHLIIAGYNKQNGKDLRPRKRSWKRLLQILNP
jgi:NADH oxidase (H2O2-forming)